MNRRLVFVAVIAALSAAALAFSGAFDVVESRVSPGAPAPDFRAVTLDTNSRIASANRCV